MKDSVSTSIGSFLYKKRLNAYFYDTAYKLYPQLHKRWLRLSHCCDEVVVRQDTHSVVQAKYYCEDPLCPLCQAKKARSRFMDAFMAVKDFIEDYDWYLVTLTVVNPSLDQLISCYDSISYGFKKFIHSRMFKVVAGGIRSFEVTFNTNPRSNAYHTFHPHLHVLCAVKKGDRMFSTEECLKQWRKNVGDDRITQVDVRPCTGDIQKSIAEVCKYSARVDWSKVKVDDSGELLLNGLMSLAKKNTFGYFGILKPARRDINRRKKEDIRKFRQDYIAEVKNRISQIIDLSKLEGQELSSIDTPYFVVCDTFEFVSHRYVIRPLYTDYYSNILETDLPDKFKRKYIPDESAKVITSYFICGGSIAFELLDPLTYSSMTCNLVDIRPSDDPVQYFLDCIWNEDSDFSNDNEVNLNESD